MKCPDCDYKMKGGICGVCGFEFYEATPPALPFWTRARLTIIPYFIQYFFNYVKWKVKGR
jgi:hypothetical protein